MTYILAIDQGTTSTRAIVYDDTMTFPLPAPQEEFPSISPQFRLGLNMIPTICGATTQGDLPRAIGQGGDQGRRYRGIGITNQARNGRFVWDKKTRRPIYKRHRLAGPPHAQPSAAPCAMGHEEMFTDRHRFAADPYFSRHQAGVDIGTNVEVQRERCGAEGELCLAPVDCFLILESSPVGLSRERNANQRRRGTYACYDIRKKAGGSRSIAIAATSAMEMLQRFRIAPTDFSNRSRYSGGCRPHPRVAATSRRSTVGQACFPSRGC